MKQAIKSMLQLLVPHKYRRGVQRALRRVLYFGFRYKCPFCGAQLRTLLPIGVENPVFQRHQVIGGGRRKAKCPVCGATDRQRLLYLYLLHKTDLFERPMKLLHVAPELELESILRSNSAIDYLTADMCSNNVMEQMDLRDIQYSDGTFDAIICNHVLEHIDDDAKAISELHRVLKQAGWGILQVPISRTLAKTYEDFSIVDAKERKAAFGQADHVRIYGKDYQDRLVQAGFVVNAFRWSSEPELFGGSKNLYGLNEEEHVYAVSKEL